ncbi:hypothetical protein PAAG_12046 [Paracoccidioides lutzii Pb01]|uniref:Uncharacterized protein n=1 Tax=Paracoccidioides lutzii (strain ATCC MYA-826 / Pb01) TaxID=502779 RepID=A0A0A2V562_PARBA|nr:hypothetical protein PAAG_12046 [Paracoccidioides lutzii Pb01]KGQ01275.1 hypothetical protein PAAG_12046 [Paracoccidioides lutzii Pb01]
MQDPVRGDQLPKVATEEIISAQSAQRHQELTEFFSSKPNLGCNGSMAFPAISFLKSLWSNRGTVERGHGSPFSEQQGINTD